MTNEHHHSRDTGLLSRRGSKAKGKHGSISIPSANGGGVVSKVIGSIRRGRRDKQKESPTEEQQQRELLANYQGTHHPDRPQVDKRTREKLSDIEYVYEIQRMQERSERYHGLSERSRSRGTDRSRTPSGTLDRKPSLSHLSDSFWNNSEYETNPSNLNKWALPKYHKPKDQAPDSPVSPGAVTIQVYHERPLDRGPIIRHGEAKRKGLLLGKVYDPSEPLKPKGTPSPSFEAAKPTRRESSKPASGNPNANTPDMVLNSSSTILSHPRSAPSPPKPADTNINSLPTSPTEPAEPPRTCPWPGCNAVLTTDQEKENNLCTVCHESLYPRQSAFFDMSEDETPPFVGAVELAVLRNLVGARAKANAETIEKSTSKHDTNETVVIQRVDSKFSTNSFKLQPAPRGKRQQSPESVDDGRRKLDTARRVSSSRSQHIGFQDMRWFPISPKRPDAKSQQGEEASRSRAANRISRSSSSNDSWTTDTRCTGNNTPSSNNSSSAFTNNHPPTPHSPPDLGPPFLITGDSDSSLRTQQLHRHPSRETVLYEQIEEIIDCYTTLTVGVKTAEREQRKVDAVATYFEREPEEVEMRRRGFI